MGTGCSRASEAARSESGIQTIAEALVIAPASKQRRIASVTTSESPRSSAFTITNPYATATTRIQRFHSPGRSPDPTPLFISIVARGEIS